VGEAGTILHYNGSTWSALSSATSYPLVGVWGSSSSDVFAVGEHGAILHYDGSTWNAMSSGTSEHLYGVWGGSSSDVFAVGWWGTILHYDGSTWSAMDSGTSNDLYGVWGSSSSDIFAVGWHGTILHYDGSTWSAMSCGTSNPLRGVWGSSSSDVFAAGWGGTILHYREAAVTAVYISPSSQTVHEGDFTVDVRIDPAVPIAGAQLSLSFDPSLVTAKSVAEGNLFKQNGAPTFFGPGTIDNVAGTITNVFGAIMQAGGSVSSPDTFATITFTAGTSGGTSPLDLSGVMVGDPSGHPVPTAVTGGSVTVELCPDWDVNCDGCIDVLDIILVGQHFDETGAPHWIREDVNRDALISVLDIILIGQHFGEGCD